MSIARLTIIRLREPPKALVARGGRDAEVVETLQFLARKYHRPCSLTLEQLEVGISHDYLSVQPFADSQALGLWREQKHADEGLQLWRGWYAFERSVRDQEAGFVNLSDLVSKIA